MGTRNIGKSNTFVVSPADNGYLYRWNSKNGVVVTSNDFDFDFIPVGTVWEDTMNPCPDGWTLPTKEQYEALLSLPYRFVTAGANGEYGMYGILIGGNCETATSKNPNGCLYIPMNRWRSADGNRLGTGLNEICLYTIDGYSVFYKYNSNGSDDISFNNSLYSALPIRCVQ